MLGAVSVMLNEIIGKVLSLPVTLVGYLLGKKMGKTSVLFWLIELCELVQRMESSLFKSRF
jgi:biotin transporter BioY